MSSSLSEHLPLLATAPDGIKKLRGLILELAVRGKLVEQDPDDEPASELLKRRSTEPLEKRVKPLSPVAIDARPFVVPEGWAWCRFGQVLDFQGGGQPPKNLFSATKLPGYVQLIQIRDLGEKPQPVFIKRESAAKFCTPNDVMVGRYGASVGKVFWGKDGAYNVALVKMIDPQQLYASQFLYLLLKSPLGQSYFCGISRSAQNGFNKADLEGRPIPVLPLAEQHRIVAKVNELMALCDRLEAEQADSGTAHARLVETLLGTLSQSPGADDLAANWQRLAEHFDTLFSTEASIDALKQTILQLAVMGKLVPQDPGDEPASELLKRIAEERKRLETGGQIKKSRNLTPVSKDEQAFSLPNGWQWARAQEAFDVRDGTHDTPKYVERDGVPLITSRNFDDGKISFEDARLISLEDHEAIKKRSGVCRGDILYSMIGGNIGNQVIVDTDREFSIKNVALFKYYLPTDTLPAFLNILLKTVTFGIKRNASGGAQPFVALSR